jgi:hypothetical protein
MPKSAGIADMKAKYFRSSSFLEGMRINNVTRGLILSDYLNAADDRFEIVGCCF